MSTRTLVHRFSIKVTRLDILYFSQGKVEQRWFFKFTTTLLGVLMDYHSHINTFLVKVPSHLRRYYRYHHYHFLLFLDSRLSFVFSLSLPYYGER